LNDIVNESFERFIKNTHPAHRPMFQKENRLKSVIIQSRNTVQ